MAATKKTITATPEQIMKFGHIASALRKFLESKDWGPGDLNVAMGKDKSYSSAYQWINGKNAPTGETRTRLSKLTGIPEEQLTSRNKNDIIRQSAIVEYKPVRVSGGVQTANVLTFTVKQDATARIQLDIVLPLDAATPLLRMLLDAGLIFKSQK
jgi:hypothetical protein